MSDEEDDYLVPDRDCGSCTVCCRDLAIVHDGMNKLPGITCEHCVTGGGCGIYATRPNVCRTYHCAWRSLDHLDESWRPDRSGILINLEVREDGADANMIVVGDVAVLQNDRFAGMAAGFVASGTAAYLVLPSGVGFMSYHVLLNELLAPAIARRDLAEVKAIIAECHETLAAQPPVPIGPEQMTPGYLGGAVRPSAALVEDRL